MMSVLRIEAAIAWTSKLALASLQRDIYTQNINELSINSALIPILCTQIETRTSAAKQLRNVCSVHGAEQYAAIQPNLHFAWLGPQCLLPSH